jgi:hypothetical protein
MTEIDPAQIGGTSRFYEKEFPDLEECVMVNVKSIAEMGAYVQVRRKERERGASMRTAHIAPHAGP